MIWNHANCSRALRITTAIIIVITITSEMSYDPRSWMQFLQLRIEALKNSGLQRSLNPWPRDTRAML